MFWYFLRSFAGSLRANKVLSLINVLSLGLGLTVFALAGQYVAWELSYDRALPNAERVHRLVLEQRGLPGLQDGEYTRMNPQSLVALHQYVSSEIEHLTRVSSLYVRPPGITEGGYSMSVVDPAFADIFAFEVLDGSLRRVLQNPGLLALEESTAASLGDSGQVGQRLRLSNVQTEKVQEFEIGAIYRLPRPSSVNYTILTVISDYTAALLENPSTRIWEASVEVWLRLSDGVRTEALNARMPQFVDSSIRTFDGLLAPGERVSEHLFYRLQALRDVHLNPVGFEAIQRSAGDRNKVLTFAVVGLLVLVVGCSNSASLSLAQALKRRKEIGIRKASGAQSASILLHYLGESLLLALLACLLAAALQHILREPLMALLNINELPPLGLGGSAVLLGIASIAGLLNGIYPGIVLARLRPQRVLKPGHEETGAGTSFRLRKLLLSAQFSLTVLFLSAAAVLYAQLQATLTQPLGYESRNVLLLESYAPMPDGVEMALALRQLPGVVNAVPVSVPPGFNLPLSYGGVTLVLKDETVSEQRATRVEAVEGFFQLMEIPLLAGRLLQAGRDEAPRGREAAAELAPPAQSVLVNRRAATELGFLSPEQAVGQAVFQRHLSAAGEIVDRPLLIVGVVEDHQYMSLRRRPVPEVYVLPAQVFTFNVLLRFEDAWASSIEERVREAYGEYGESLAVRFVESNVEREFIQERSASRLLLLASGLALLLSCIGLYGLAATLMERSVKEVGVRKAIGAGVGSLVALFLWRFSRPVLLANLVAWPLAGWFVLSWIRRFPYQIDLAWLPPIFLAASLLVLLVAWLTVAGVTARAALRAPVQSLRYE